MRKKTKLIPGFWLIKQSFNNNLIVEYFKFANIHNRKFGHEFELFILELIIFYFLVRYSFTTTRSIITTKKLKKYYYYYYFLKDSFFSNFVNNLNCKVFDSLFLNNLLDKYTRNCSQTVYIDHHCSMGCWGKDSCLFFQEL
jgi:hypothetical protein